MKKEIRNNLEYENISKVEPLLETIVYELQFNLDVGASNELIAEIEKLQIRMYEMRKAYQLKKLNLN